MTTKQFTSSRLSPVIRQVRMPIFLPSFLWLIHASLERKRGFHLLITHSHVVVLVIRAVFVALNLKFRWISFGSDKDQLHREGSRRQGGQIMKGL